MESKETKIALLIDADNVSYKHFDGIFNEITKHGRLTIKRVYGNFSTKVISELKHQLEKHSQIPIQVFNNIKGKNATDIVITIDAMDILNKNLVDVFCIVSSDSDFTRLAQRIRESGKLVIGMGEKKTNETFVNSCNKFIYINQEKETISKKSTQNINNKNIKTQNSTCQALNKKNLPKGIMNLITQSVKEIANKDEWSCLSSVANLIRKKQPNFKPKDYGFSKLSTLFQEYNSKFELQTRNANTVYVKLK